MPKKIKTPFHPNTSTPQSAKPLTELDGRTISEPWDDEEWRSLQLKLMQFTMRDEYYEFVQRAKRQFARGYHVWEEDDPEIETFFEWAMRDVRLASGRSILDDFHHRCQTALPTAEREALEFGIRRRGQRLWEYRGAAAGKRQSVREILGGEDWTVNDPEIRDDAPPWTIIFARLSLKAGEPAFQGPRYFLPPQYMTEIRTFTAALLDSWRAGNPRADIGEFYRERFLLLVREVRRLQEEATRIPEVRTPEGHAFAPMAAEFSVRDPRRVEEALDGVEEFEREEPDTKTPGEIAFVWLQRGRSGAFFGGSAAPDITGEMLAGFQFSPGDEPAGKAGRMLGRLTLSGGTMRLECVSRERLAAGKELLVEILGGLARPHKKDIPLEMDEPDDEEESALAPELPAELKQRLRDHITMRWLELSIPALGGLTPRQAAKMPKGRHALEELLKQFEYMDSREDNPGAIDLTRIRRELGMEKPE